MGGKAFFIHKYMFSSPQPPPQNSHTQTQQQPSDVQQHLSAHELSGPDPETAIENKITFLNANLDHLTINYIIVGGLVRIDNVKMAVSRLVSV